MAGPDLDQPSPPPNRPTRLAFIGTLGAHHSRSVAYDLVQLRSLVERLEPDLLAVEADRTAWEDDDRGRLPAEVVASLAPAARLTDTVLVPLGGPAGHEFEPPTDGGLAGVRATVIKGADGLLDVLARAFDSPGRASRGLYPHICAFLCRLEYAAASGTGRRAWRETNEGILANLLQVIDGDPGRRVLAAVQCRRIHWLEARLAVLPNVEIVPFDCLTSIDRRRPPMSA